MTAYGREEVFHEAEGAGLESVLVKPVSPSLLFDTAIRALAGDAPASRRRRRSRRRSRRVDLVGCAGRASSSSRTTSSTSRSRWSCWGSADVQVDVASNGEEGVRRVQEKDYGLVLMDLQMPVMDGFEATRRIRALHGREALPILAMTANAMEGDRERSLAAGMNDHVTKPIDPDALFEALLRWLPERPLRRRRWPRRRRPRRARLRSRAGRWRRVPLPRASPPATRSPRRRPRRRRRPAARARQARGVPRPAAPFASGQRSAPDVIRAALAEGRQKDAERAAHTLKGVAGSIGARQLQAQAGEVEAALRRGAPPPRWPHSSTAPPSRSPRSSALSPPSSRRRSRPWRRAVDPEALAAAIGRIEELLEQDDVEAVGALDEAAPLLSAAFGGRAASLRKLLKGYRFEEALAVLREAAAEWRSGRRP